MKKIIKTRGKKQKPKGTKIRKCSRSYTYKRKHKRNRSITDVETSIEGTT